MVPPKSQIDFYVDLCEQLISCDPLAANTSKHLRKDIETMKSRCRHEGLSFLTKSLPKLGKALDYGLENSKFTIPSGFSHSAKNRSIPAFLQAYFNLVFDAEGILRDDASGESIRFIRQVCYLCYKLEAPYSKETEAATVASFVNTDEELKLLNLENLDLELEILVTEDVFRDFDHRDIVPRHGPGAVATGERLDTKWEFSRKYLSIHRMYPYYDYFIVGGARELGDRLRWYKDLTPLDSGCAKVVLVPKDSRGPRLISCEPLEYQWIQQGLGRKLMCHLESFSLTRGHINFTHQSINQKLALESSISRKFATLDLKDASDRVSLQLVRKVFRNVPKLLAAFEATRTTRTRVPSGKEVTLNKFAPMGSALCFPVEAYLFWVLVVCALARAGVPLRRGRNLCYVYGDDLIVPQEYAEVSMQALESVGLLVNRDKSCIKGFFRESCGVDAFMGINVTPSRVRKPWTGRRTDGSAYASYVSLANAFDGKGYTKASRFLWNELEKTYGYIPYGTSSSSFPCKLVSDPSVAYLLNRKKLKNRWNGSLHKPEVYVLTLQSRSIKTSLDSWPRLLRNMVSPPFEDPSVTSIPRSMKIKRRWRAIA